jgi:hypothetical protein
MTPAVKNRPGTRDAVSEVLNLLGLGALHNRSAPR